MDLDEFKIPKGDNSISTRSETDYEWRLRKWNLHLDTIEKSSDRTTFLHWSCGEILGDELVRNNIQRKDTERIVAHLCDILSTIDRAEVAWVGDRNAAEVKTRVETDEEHSEVRDGDSIAPRGTRVDDSGGKYVKATRKGSFQATGEPENSGPSKTAAGGAAEGTVCKVILKSKYESTKK